MLANALPASRFGRALEAALATVLRVFIEIHADEFVEHTAWAQLLVEQSTDTADTLSVSACGRVWAHEPTSATVVVVKACVHAFIIVPSARTQLVAKQTVTNASGTLR